MLTIKVDMSMLRYPVAMNKTDEKRDIKMIDMYSARKTITNKTDLYSVLNPLTNSDSPSAKSKGDRLDSARMETLNTIYIINIHIITPICVSCEKSYVVKIMALRTTSLILTS